MAPASSTAAANRPTAIAAQDAKRHCRILAQRRILSPDSQQSSATGEHNGAGHTQEQDRRTKLRDVRYRPGDDSRAGARGFILHRLQPAKRRREKEYGGRHHQQPLQGGKDRQSESSRRRFLNVFHDMPSLPPYSVNTDRMA